jgi:hypothetical protein
VSSPTLRDTTFYIGNPIDQELITPVFIQHSKLKKLHNNPISQLFSIRYPIIQAGMIWASGWKLASAVSNAGGLGYILVSTFRKSHIGEQNEYHEVY